MSFASQLRCSGTRSGSAAARMATLVMADEGNEATSRPFILAAVAAPTAVGILTGTPMATSATAWAEMLMGEEMSMPLVTAAPA